MEDTGSPARRRRAPEISSCPPQPFSMLIEEMKHISRFQLTLRLDESIEKDNILENLSISIIRKGESCSIVCLKEHIKDQVLFEAELPRALDEASYQAHQLDERTIQLQVPYLDDPFDNEMHHTQTLTPIESINRIRCRFCQQYLLPSHPIQRTSQLPVGQWDEIADYLICYNGQAVVDFSTASLAADPTVALQDESVLCLNQFDMNGTVCVRPVTGYGEEGDSQQGNYSQTEASPIEDFKDVPATVRGDRLWRDVTGGATVCCSQCSSPLGFAGLESPDTFRLLKHRLSLPNPRDATTSRPLSKCASFVAREMVRYAEAKAIFTFVVALQTPKFSFVSKSFTKCILLRLVNWDTNMATCYKEGSTKPDFRPFAKIVFEETLDRLGNQRRSGDEETVWEWGGVDLCCPPFGETQNETKRKRGQERKRVDASTEGKVSSVRIILQDKEYSEILKSLREGQQLFPRAIAEATILVKMGTLPSADSDKEGLGLTAIALCE